MTPEDAESFYEEDEPLEKIIAAYERGPKFLTGRADWRYDALAQIRWGREYIARVYGQRG